jgi:hypothetical protein
MNALPPSVRDRARVSVTRPAVPGRQATVVVSLRHRLGPPSRTVSGSTSPGRRRCWSSDEGEGVGHGAHVRRDRPSRLSRSWVGVVGTGVVGEGAGGGRGRCCSAGRGGRHLSGHRSGFHPLPRQIASPGRTVRAGLMSLPLDRFDLRHADRHRPHLGSRECCRSLATFRFRVLLAPSSTPQNGGEDDSRVAFRHAGTSTGSHRRGNRIGWRRRLPRPPRARRRGPGILFLHWFDPEAPDGNRTQFLEEAADLAISLGAVSVLPQGKFPWDIDPAGAEGDARSDRGGSGPAPPGRGLPGQTSRCR